MSEGVAGTILAALASYAAVGFAFALAFAARGAARVDPGAHEAGWGFRLIILPGATALWPLLLVRWFSGVHEPPDERNAHRAAARRQ